MRIRSLITLTCLVVLAACEGAPTPLAPEPDRLTISQSKIGPEVVQALQNGGSARVIIALASGEIVPGPYLAPGVMSRGQSQLRAMQTAIVDDLGDELFTVRRRYDAVPALAGILRSEAALAKLESDPNIRRVDLDMGGTGSLGASVPFIGANLRHAAGNQGEGTVVAVIDSGADSDHPDLIDDVIGAGQACFGDRNGVIDGVGFCPNGSDRQTGPGAAEDDAGHGTHVSGIITSNGTQSSVGVAPGAGILPIKVTYNCSFAGCFDYTSEVIAALDYIITNNATLHVQLINMSLGTRALFAGDCDNVSGVTMAGAAAVNTLRTMGVLVFASAANDGQDGLMSMPACLSNVISVGASDYANAPAGFTNSSSTTDIFAPGVGIVSSLLGGGTTAASGTSMASPTAAGCAALLIQAGDATTPDQIEARLETSPFSVVRGANTFPRIDCSPAPPPPPTVASNVAGTLGDNGWYIDDVQVTWTVDLKGGSVISTSGCDPTTVDYDSPGVPLTCSVTTAGGTTEESVNVKRDATAPTANPTLSGPLGDNGWYTGAVTVSWAATDALSGVATPCADEPVGSDGLHTASCAPVDGAGNVGSADVDFRIDATPPVVTYAGNAGVYDVAAAIAITCSASDALSGIASDTCVDVVGPAFAFLGVNTFSATATDNAGNVGTGETAFTVTASYTGVCTLVEAWVEQNGVANSLCAKLNTAAKAQERGNVNARNGALGAFINEVAAQAGKKVPADKAPFLTAMAQALMG